MNVCMLFLYKNDLMWHITTAFLFFCLLLIFLAFFWIFYKMEKISLYLTEKIVDSFISLTIAMVIFRTFYFHYAFVFWGVLYLLAGLIEKNKRKIRYINWFYEKNAEYRKAYKHIHAIDANKNFLGCIKENVLLSQNFHLSNLKIDKKDTAWKKSFLPFNYFAIGLFSPCLNLLINGSQYSTCEILLLQLFEINILIFVVLWFLYPVTSFLAVRIETGIMFESQFWFNLGYFLFSFAVFFVLNGILITQAKVSKTGTILLNKQI